MSDTDSFVPRVLESRAKTIDEAIFKGMQEMDVSIDEVQIETIQEGSKGILGIGSKPYIVRLTEKDPRAVLKEMRGAQAAEKPQEEQKRPEAPAREERREAPKVTPAAPTIEEAPTAPAAMTAPSVPPTRENRRDDGARPQRNYDSGGQRDQGRFDRNDRAPRPRGGRGRNERDYGGQNHVPVSNVAQQVAYTPFIPGESECDGAAFLLGLLEKMGVTAKLGFYQTEGLIKFRIDSETMGILIGHRGETLDAMQYLTSLVVNRGKESYRRVTLDTENYRSKREETLMRLARKIAAQVKATGKPVPLEPMNPYERRVLHAALQKNPYVETMSEGEEPNRHVIVVPKKR